MNVVTRRIGAWRLPLPATPPDDTLLALQPPMEDWLERPLSPIRLQMIVAVSTVMFLAVLISCIAKIDIYATASARIQPAGRSKVVQPLQAGTVRAIHVENGRHVREGDLLIELDPTETAADRESLLIQIADLDAQVARRRAALAAAQAGPTAELPTIGFPPGLNPAVQSRELAVFVADVANLRSSLAALDGQIAVNMASKSAAGLVIAEQEQLIAALRESLGMQEAIAQKGLGSRASVLTSQTSVAAQMTSLASLKGQVLRADVSAKAVERQKSATLTKFQDDQSQALSAALEKRDELAQSLVKASAKLGYTRLLAPISGVIQDIAVTTIGQVVLPGQELMVVVPENARLEAEALVINQDIGFVEQGQTAVLKIDSFPFTRYGTIPGKVIRVSHDSVSGSSAAVNGSDTSVTSPTANPNGATSPTPQVQDLVYQITIELEKSTIMADGKAVPLLPGMNATVEIRTGDRRVIDYLLSPIREVGSNAAHER